MTPFRYTDKDTGEPDPVDPGMVWAAKVVGWCIAVALVLIALSFLSSLTGCANADKILWRILE